MELKIYHFESNLTYPHLTVFSMIHCIVIGSSSRLKFNRPKQKLARKTTANLIASHPNANGLIDGAAQLREQTQLGAN